MTTDLQRFAEPDFWRTTAPTLHVDDCDFLLGDKPLRMTAPELKTLSAEVAKEGYTRFKPRRWTIDVAALAATIADLKARQIMPVFAFVFDEAWCLFREIRPYLAKMLGPEYRMLPDFWAWHVEASDRDGGWQPHRDKGGRSLFVDGRPKSMTTWIALSEATPENGCIYLVPADRDPAYNTAEDDQFKFGLGDIRALPCGPGTVLSWNQAVLHWGSRSSVRAKAPRISVAFEFQRGDVPPFNVPLLDPATPPPFATRLGLIAKQILQYQHIYPLSAEMKAFAERAVAGR